MGPEYRVIYTRDPDGVRWNAEVVGKPGGCGCRSWGRSLREARARIRDALATAVEDDEAAENAVLVEQFRRMRL